MLKDRNDNNSSELSDIREILGTIVANMVTKDEFQTFKKEMFGFKEDMLGFQQETWQNFKDVRSDIADLRKETDFELEDLLGRVKYVEQKLGIESGK